MKLYKKAAFAMLAAIGGLTAPIYSAHAVGERILFIRGGDVTTGGHEKGSASVRTEQAADIFNTNTNGGNHGWKEFADALREKGYVLEQVKEDRGNQDAGYGPEKNRGVQYAGVRVNLAGMNLSQYDVIVFGSNNAVYQKNDIDAVQQYVMNGGQALFISDSNFGSNQADASDSDQQFLDRFGLIMNQDRGTYTLNIANHALIPSHPILTGVSNFDGEGVTPISLSNNPPSGVTTRVIVRIPGSQQVKLNNAPQDPNRNTNRAGSSRRSNANDGALVEATYGSGRVIGHFDRNTFFNQRGAGTWLTRARDSGGRSLQNRTYAQNLFEYMITDGVNGNTGNPGEPDDRVSRNNWTLSASRSQGQLGNAIDGNLNTRWATNQFQTPGQFVVVDMKAAENVGRLVLNSGRDTNDYPRGYIVSGSTDGNNYQQLATGQGSSAVVDISFTAGSYRYLRIEQTGSSPVNWWSISDLSVYKAEVSGGEEQFAFGAPFQPIPGKIEAESYDEGGQGVAYNDRDPQQRGQFHRQREGVDVGDAASASDGRFVGWINDGEWLEYTSEIVPGTYDFTLSVADLENASGMIRMLVDGVEVGTTNVPVTGSWTKFEDITIDNVDLSAYSGRHIFRIEFINGSFNLDSITSAAAGSSNPGNGGTSTQLSRTGWSVNASTSRDTNNAVDGIAGSRWATRATQTAGQTFTINLGATRNVDRIVLDSAGNPNDYPRGYIVRVSNDGINYRDVTSGNGSSAVTDINFAGQTTRYIQIEQTGSSNVNWWSIHEVNLYGKN